MARPDAAGGDIDIASFALDFTRARPAARSVILVQMVPVSGQIYPGKGKVVGRCGAAVAVMAQ
ncbi:hypothetical protein [Actinobaculum sp. 313]|uniref:hypothetical protein n=1 Tax=Actinobaculum sp. 313 TaxID=2495645 RepID=UPI000D5262A6|nr:hypothetical protein [Actinobaculum sp. 313]AWE41902.1 hypothetical protein DDD63_03065 [Actinobaculum sp. 313]